MTERLFLDQPELARVDATVLASAPEGIENSPETGF